MSSGEVGWGPFIVVGLRSKFNLFFILLFYFLVVLNHACKRIKVKMDPRV